MEMGFKDIVVYVINYRKMKAALREWNYKDLGDELEFTMRDIRGMERQCYNAFLHYVQTGEFLSEWLNDVNVKELIEQRQMAPAGAFLAASLVKTNPALGYFIVSGFKDGYTDLAWDPEEEEEPDDLKELMELRRAAAGKRPQDTSDFVTRTEEEP